MVSSGSGAVENVQYSFIAITHLVSLTLNETIEIFNQFLRLKLFKCVRKWNWIIGITLQYFEPFNWVQTHE